MDSRRDGPTRPDDRAGRRRRWPWIAAAVLTALAAVAIAGVAQYRQSVRHTEEGVLRSDLERLRDAVGQYLSDKGKYPASLDALVAEGYLRRVPEDPITKSTGTWRTVAAGQAVGAPAPPGIADVKSGAAGTALDGTRYADW